MASLGLISHPASSRDIAIFRPNEIEEGELTNCRFLSRTDSRIVVGAAGDGLTRSSNARPSDREPGEVFDDSGSDGGFTPRSRFRKTDTGISDDGNKRSTLDNEKGKSSSVDWIRDCAKADRHVSVRISQSIDDRTSITVPLPGKIDVAAAAAFFHVSTAYESSRSVSPLSTVEDGPAKFCMDNSHGAAVLDDYVSIPSISACRWANDAESPADEDGYFYDEMPKLKRKMPVFSSVEELQRLKRKRSVPGTSETTWKRKSMTDDFAKFREEGSEGEMVSSLDERTRSSSSCIDQDENDIDITLDHNQIGPISGILETDSDDSCSPHGSPPRSLNMLQGCRNVNEFKRLSKINEGTYGIVYKAKDKKSGEIVALKKVKMEKESEGFPLTALREINILLALHHPSVVGVKEVVVGSDLDSIFMSMEYMDHDLRELMMTMKYSFSQSEVKCLMLQLLEGVKYLHDNWVLHRDLKSSNLLLNNRGELKICDLGLARQYGSPLKPYTALVVTLWYRAPELLLGAKEYSTAIDMWSVGCIMAELLSKKPLFDGKKEVDQLDKIFKLLGTPNENIWPGVSKLPGAKANFVNHRYNCLRQKFPAASFTGSPVLSDAGFCLLNSLLTLDPKQRITAEDALKHEWFQEVPLPREKEFMPTFPSQHA